MFFLFSGEGATDFGQCADGSLGCGHDRYEYGPMAVIVDQVVATHHHYSILEAECFGFVSKQMLVKKAESLKPAKKSVRLPGIKTAKETAYYFRNARALGACARAKQAE